MVPGGFEELQSVSRHFNMMTRKTELQVICNSGDSVYLVNDPASHDLEHVEGELVGLSAHEVASCDSTETMNQVSFQAPKPEE